MVLGDIRSKYLDALANDGFREDSVIIEEARRTGVCIAICMNHGCYKTIAAAPAKLRDGYCDRCRTKTITSLLVLHRLIYGDGPDDPGTKKRLMDETIDLTTPRDAAGSLLFYWVVVYTERAQRVEVGITVFTLQKSYTIALQAHGNTKLGLTVELCI